MWAARGIRRGHVATTWTSLTHARPVGLLERSLYSTTAKKEESETAPSKKEESSRPSSRSSASSNSTSSVFRNAAASFFQSLSSFMAAISPVKRLEPSAIWVMQYANGKHKVLREGINFHSPLGSVVFKGNLVHNELVLDAMPLRTDDNISVVVGSTIQFNITEIDDLGNLKADLNAWLRHQSNTLLTRTIRKVTLDELFSSPQTVEETIKTDLSGLVKSYGLECQSVLFHALIPPPDILFEFERIARDNISSAVQNDALRESHRVKHELIEKHNQFVLDQTRSMVTAYGGMLSTLAPHFKTEEGCRAAQALSNPNFLAPLQQMNHQMSFDLPSEWSEPLDTQQNDAERK